MSISAASAMSIANVKTYIEMSCDPTIASTNSCQELLPDDLHPGDEEDLLTAVADCGEEEDDAQDLPSTEVNAKRDFIAELWCFAKPKGGLQ